MSGSAVQAGKRATYPAYKPSGMDWVGDVPEHWDVQRLKHIASVQFSSVDKHTKEDETPVRLCNYVDVYYNDFIKDGIDFMTATATRSEIDRFHLRHGDVLITKDSEAWDDIAVPAYVAEEFDGVLCGYHLAHIRPDLRKVLGEYLFRAFRSRGVNDQFRVAANGITRFGLGKYWLDNGLFPVPPLDEQKAIAAFLDRETARIDALIEKKRRQMELLQEKRSALISSMISGQLSIIKDPETGRQRLASDEEVRSMNNDQRSMIIVNCSLKKDSGIEWLGQIPKHWEVRKIKHLTTKIGSGKTPRGGAEVYVDSGVMLFRSQNVHFDGLRLDDVVFIEDEIDAEMANTRVRSGDVLLNITGASLGRCCRVGEDIGPANVNQHVCIIRAWRSRAVPDYLSAAMSSFVAQSQIFASENGTSREGLNFQQVGNLLIVVPPRLEEQDEISRHIRVHTDRMDAIISTVLRSIDQLRELRTAMISAAVTGKIDVRSMNRDQ